MADATDCPEALKVLEELFSDDVFCRDLSRVEEDKPTPIPLFLALKRVPLSLRFDEVEAVDFCVDALSNEEFMSILRRVGDIVFRCDPLSAVPGLDNLLTFAGFFLEVSEDGCFVLFDTAAR